MRQPERSLWIAVVEQALVDLAISPGSRNPELRKIRQKAVLWFFSPTERKDFITTCELAGIEPSNLESVARKMRGMLVSPSKLQKLIEKLKLSIVRGQKKRDALMIRMAQVAVSGESAIEGE